MFASAGFAPMAELHYMVLPVKAGQPPPPLPPGLAWQTYSPANHALFARAILATYQDSLDCPALNGLREIDDIILGHQASGQFEPQLWFVLVEQSPAVADELPGGMARGGPGDATGDATSTVTSGAASAAEPTPLGVVLVSPSPRSESAELVYLGITPAARGRQIVPSVGRPMKVSELMMKQAIAAVSGHGMGRLSLAVDSRNVPALKLYFRHGCQRIGAKIAALRNLRKHALADS